MTYSLRQGGADTVTDMGGGHQIVLVTVQLSTLPSAWIFGILGPAAPAAKLAG
jgi:hypothetical protein